MKLSGIDGQSRKDAKIDHEQQFSIFARNDSLQTLQKITTHNFARQENLSKVGNIYMCKKNSGAAILKFGKE